MMRASWLLVFLPLPGCFGDPPDVESSATTEATGSPSTTEDASSTNVASASPSTSSDTNPASAEATSDALTSSSEGSAGSTTEVVDFALQFDGTGMVVSTRPIVWSSNTFTAEAWVELLSDGASGVIVDQQDAALMAGWVLHLHPTSHVLIFALYDPSGTPYQVEGPTSEAIGTGWHHVAATYAGGVLSLFVDGAPVADIPGPNTMGATNTPIALAAHNQPQPEMWRLRNATIDDVRIVTRALYEEPFDPPTQFDDVGDVVMLLRLDEGMGTATEDALTGAKFDVENGAWVMGRP
jgi:hypothetical protein